MLGFGKSASRRTEKVNALDYPVRYAAWFGSRRTNAAIVLAKASGFNSLTIDSALHEELASRLVEGAVVSGALQLGILNEDLARDIEALVSERNTSTAREPGVATDVGETPQDGVQEVVADATASVEPSSGGSDDEDSIWSGLQAGTLVVAADLDRFGAIDAWYEATLVRREGREFVLRWRDFPREGLLTRTQRHIAILPPAE